MHVSEARLAANRANGLKSKGPTSAEGKIRSRANSYKHGMTGAGVVMPAEEAAEVERRAAEFEADYRPGTGAGKAMVRRAAMLSVRLERCEAQEAAAVSENVHAAEAKFDEARETEVDILMGDLAEHPGPALRNLMRMPEGVDRMIAVWGEIRWDLARGDGSRWGREHDAMAIGLSGRKPGGFGMNRIEALVMAFHFLFQHLEEDDGAGLDRPARSRWARQELLGEIDATVARLKAHRSTLNLEEIAADRAGARARALFDPSKEATLARKYEAAAERGMHRALQEMRAAEKAAAAATRPGPARAPAVAAASPRLGSFSEGGPARPEPPATTPEEPRSGVVTGSGRVPIAIGRADRASS